MRARLTLAGVAVLLACGRTPGGRTVDATPGIEVAVGRQPVDLAVGDLDRDGALDLVTANGGDRSLSVRLQRGGAWIAPAGPPLGLDVAPHLVALADLDADGDLDIVASAHDAGAVWAWLGDGTGAFAPAAGSPFAIITAPRPHNHGLAVGDLDGDGDPDVVVADQDARAAGVLLGDGRGGLVPASTSPVALGAQAYPPALADVDGDRQLDLVVPLVGSDAVAVMLGDGRGGLRHAPGSPHGTGIDRPYGILVADLDGDGDADVIAAHDDTDRVSVLLGDGTGRLHAAPGSPVSLGDRIWRMAAADVTGDGAVDVLGAGSGWLITLPGDGRGGFAAPRRTPFGGWMVVAADLDADGAVDVAAPDSEANAVRIALGFRP